MAVGLNCFSFFCELNNKGKKFQNFTVALEASLLGKLFISWSIFQPWHYPPIYQQLKGVYLLNMIQFVG